MDRTTSNRTVAGCQAACCVGAWVGTKALGGGTISVPVLELRFQLENGAVTTRRFLLDRAHPGRLKSFLEGFLGRPLRSLWEWAPGSLVGQRGCVPAGDARA